MYVHVYGGQRSTIGIVPQVIFTMFLRDKAPH